MKFILPIMLALLTACVSAPAPKTTAQQIAYSQATLTGLANSAASLVETGAMSKEDGRAVLKSVVEAQAGIDLARKFMGQNLPTDAVAQLQLVQKILIELNAYLASKEPK